MAKLSVTVPHCLTQDEAVKRVKTLFNNMKNQFAGKIRNLREEWDNNMGRFSFSAMGFSVSGTIFVEPTKIEISCNLPFAAMLFKGEIKSAIREQAKALLA